LLHLLAIPEKTFQVQENLQSRLLSMLFGHSGLLIHGDTLVLDRWLWLKKRLPNTNSDDLLLDCGCGSGAISVAAAKRGYQVTGINNDDTQLEHSTHRAKQYAQGRAKFEKCDLRELSDKTDLHNQFDVVICFEAIEHILDDRKLFRALVQCLKPGGRLLLTTPYFHYKAMSPEDDGPISKVEHGGHVRRGYTPIMLRELCRDAAVELENISYCSGILSQKLTILLRAIAKLNYGFGWLVTFPLRPFPPIFDTLFTLILRWPNYSICLEAYKPRWIDKPQ